MNKFRFLIKIEKLTREESVKIMTALYELGYEDNDFTFIEEK